MKRPSASGNIQTSSGTSGVVVRGCDVENLGCESSKFLFEIGTHTDGIRLSQDHAGRCIVRRAGLPSANS
jgi:hypothetical protein